MTPIVEFCDVTLGYGSRSVIEGASFQVPPGDYLALVGPNGSGKTTMLRGLLGLLKPRRGCIEWRQPRPRIGYVPQRQRLDDLFPVSVQEVVRMGRYGVQWLRPVNLAEEHRLVSEALVKVGLEGVERKLFRHLSGGQQQRALMARALVSSPELLILDEPTSGMDIVGEASTFEFVSQLNGEGLTVVLVTHSLALVADRARSLALLHNGQVVHGPVVELLSETHLRSVYGVPILVTEVGGHRLLEVQSSR